MPQVFSDYAQYYEMVYSDKQYAQESAFIQSRLSHFGTSASILELGCGTGTHAALLAAQGIRVTGIDLSETMLEFAQSKRGNSGKLAFFKGDARTFRSGTTFDSVVSLFHVASYQTTNSDIQAMLETAQVHLRPGGLFMFDFWYGPAVLTQRPEPRIKRLENEQLQITRVAEPKLHLNENVVDVNYTILIRKKSDQSVQEVQETHRMRYFFMPEIQLLLQQAGFEVLETNEWLSAQPPSAQSWGVYVVARKRN